MKKFLAVMLAVMLGVSVFGGCSESKTENNQKETKKSNEELIIGEWKAELDWTNMMQETFSDDVMAEYIKVPEFKVAMLFTFDQEGTMTVGIDEEGFNTNFKSIFEEVKKGMKDYFEAIIKNNKMDMTVDELLELSGTDFDKLMDGMAEVAMETMDLDALSFSYKYEVKEDKLYAYEEGAELNENDFITIRFVGNDRLNFVSETNGDDDNVMKMIQKLTRVK